MSKLSVTVITLNEEENIRRCLESVKYLADEIVVVDSGSKDSTLQIAKEFKAQVFTREFDNFANQKNWAASKASGEWILSVDADEVIPNPLSKEIAEAIKSPQYSAYLIPRRNFILGAEIKHSRWSPDKHIWLWKKEDGKWSGDVHEEVVVSGKVGELKGTKIHYQDKTVSEFISSNRKYADLCARKMLAEGKKFSLLHFLWDPVFEFGIRYIYKKGFLDGWRGLVLSILMAYYRFNVWMKVLSLNENNNKL